MLLGERDFATHEHASLVIDPSVFQNAEKPSADGAKVRVEAVKAFERCEDGLLRNVIGLILRGSVTGEVAMGPWK